MAGIGPLSEEGLVRLLTYKGKRVKNARFGPYAEDLTAEDLRSFWRNMMMTRAFDNEATSLQRQGELGLWVASLGQEAAQIGSASVLRNPDYVFPSYREHGVAFMRGIDLPEILRTFRGHQHGAWDPAAHNFHLYTLVIGAHSLHAVGYAQAMDWDGLVGSGNPDADGAVVCYIGDGATSQGDVNEALIFAAVNTAPVVFFVQNNQFAISESTTRQSKVPLAQRADGVGMPNVRVDGNDVIGTYAVTREAMDRARSGGGPSFIEAFTYRMGAHTTSDDPKRYRTAADEDYWRARDPLTRVESYLRAQGILDDDIASELTAEADTMAARVRSETLSLPEPEITDFYEHVFAEKSPLACAEQAQMRAYAASFEQA